LMLQLCRTLPYVVYGQLGFEMPFMLTRAIWAIGAIYACCAAIRLARFNVSNQHGEQHHFSFLGLPSPAAGGVVAAMVLMCSAVFDKWSEQYRLGDTGSFAQFVRDTYIVTLCVLPVITLAVGLLMVSTIRYPHLVNRYLRGRKTIPQLVGIVVICLALLVFHNYLIAIAMVLYTIWGLLGYLMGRFRKHSTPAPAK
jgi:CDP-diacylglycerol---serine O-phosphatidyltransferase